MLAARLAPAAALLWYGQLDCHQFCSPLLRKTLILAYGMGGDRPVGAGNVASLKNEAGLMRRTEARLTERTALQDEQKTKLTRYSGGFLRSANPLK